MSAFFGLPLALMLASGGMDVSVTAYRPPVPLDGLSKFAGLEKFIGPQQNVLFVQVDWVVDAKGTAQDVRVVRNGARSERAERCVGEALSSWAFPQGKGGDTSIACVLTVPH